MELTIPGAAARAAREFGDAEAVAEPDGARLSYRELGERVTTVAAALIASGVNPGDRVAIWCPNTVHWVLAALGSLSAGGVLVPVSSRYQDAEAGEIIGRSEAKLVLVRDKFLGHDYRAPAGVPVIDLASDFLSSGSSYAARVGADDPCDMFFTSGTTGRSKGVVMRHAQTVRAWVDWCSLTGLRAGDRYLIVSPFSHVFGYKAGCVAAAIAGAATLPVAVFDAPSVLRLVEREKVTVLPGPPTLYASLLDHPARASHDLSTLRLAVTGAAVVPVPLVERMRAELFREVVIAYGLTESCGTVTVGDPHADPETACRTVGRAIEGTEVIIGGPDGAPLPPGSSGEVLVRGYNVMRGYFEDPEATAAALDPAGWLHTGDVGTLDADGNLRITDRLKDMFVVGGFNAYPAEIEQVIARHEQVSEAAVVGVPDARLGEVGCAFVVPRPGMTVTEEEIIAFCREHLANFKVPRSVRVVAALPRNA